MNIKPDHYKRSSIECIDAIKASMTEKEYLGFLKGNIIKYLWRYDLKGGIEDLKKSQTYTDLLIKELEETKKEP